MKEKYMSGGYPLFLSVYRFLIAPEGPSTSSGMESLILQRRELYMCVHKGPTQTQDNTANEVVRKLREALQRFLDELHHEILETMVAHFAMYNVNTIIC